MNKLFKCFWFSLLIFTSGQSNSASVEFVSKKYQYTHSVPSGWTQIPNNILVRFKSEHIPKEAQHLIFDVAFQSNNTGEWFDWPYFVIQVIPSERTRITRLPTENEFEQFVQVVTGKKNIEKLKTFTGSLEDTETQKVLESFISSMSAGKVATHVPTRQYWVVIDSEDPLRGPMKAYIGGTFLDNGNLIQINAYSKAVEFKNNLSDFVRIHNSIHKINGLSQ